MIPSPWNSLEITSRISSEFQGLGIIQLRQPCFNHLFAERMNKETTESKKQTNATAQQHEPAYPKHTDQAQKSEQKKYRQDEARREEHEVYLRTKSPSATPARGAALRCQDAPHKAATVPHDHQPRLHSSSDASLGHWPRIRHSLLQLPRPPQIQRCRPHRGGGFIC